MAGVGIGDSVVIYGAGPVGLMAAMSARLRGASEVSVVDRQPERLKLVEAFDATPIDDSAGDAVQQVQSAGRFCWTTTYYAHDEKIQFNFVGVTTDS